MRGGREGGRKLGVQGGMEVDMGSSWGVAAQGPERSACPRGTSLGREGRTGSTVCSILVLASHLIWYGESPTFVA